jgi:hypothetical protein
MLEQIKACQPRPDPRLRALHHKLPPAEREKVVEFIAEVRCVPAPRCTWCNHEKAYGSQPQSTDST